jgi:hypothetical protein
MERLTTFFYSHFSAGGSSARKLLKRLEAAIGIEPVESGGKQPNTNRGGRLRLAAFFFALALAFDSPLRVNCGPMKTLLLILAVSGGVQAPKIDLIQSTSPFSPSSTISNHTFSTGASSPVKKEVGTVNGVAYEFFYSDGSGLFAGDPKASLNDSNPRNRIAAWETAWHVGCEKDPITDEKTCHADKGDFRVWTNAAGRSEVYVGSEHYPGSQVVIRIDKTSPLAINSRVYDGGFGYRASPGIINRIAAAKFVSTRYQKWPYRDYVDETWNTYGFKEALAYIKWAVAHIK